MASHHTNCHLSKAYVQTIHPPHPHPGPVAREGAGYHCEAATTSGEQASTLQQPIMPPSKAHHKGRVLSGGEATQEDISLGTLVERQPVPVIEPGALNACIALPHSQDTDKIKVLYGGWNECLTWPLCMGHGSPGGAERRVKKAHPPPHTEWRGERGMENGRHRQCQSRASPSWTVCIMCPTPGPSHPQR